MSDHDRKIGVLGGSFNPAHAGHREISLAALDWLALDAVWWLVTPGNPLKDADQYAPYTDRLAQASDVANEARIVVSDFEQRHGLQYTADTLKALTRQYPDKRFVWLMGADSLKDFHRWKNWRQITETMPFAVFNRPGYAVGALNSAAAEALAHVRLSEKAGATLADTAPPAWAYFEASNNSLSSTTIRNRA